MNSFQKPFPLHFKKMENCWGGSRGNFAVLSLTQPIAIAFGDPILGLQCGIFLSSSLSRNTSENGFPPSTCLELQHMLKITAPFKCLLEVGLSLEKISFVQKLSTVKNISVK